MLTRTQIGLVLTSTLLLGLVMARPRPGWSVWLYGAAGPLQGTARVPCPSSTADQELLLPGGVRLEVLNRRSEEPHATVRVRTVSGELLSCIYASGPEGTRVDSLRFRSVARDWRGRVWATGVVNWDYGPEWMAWYFDASGRPTEHWFSR